MLTGDVFLLLGENNSSYAFRMVCIVNVSLMEQKDEIIGYFIEQSPNEKLLNLHVNEEFGALSTSSESKPW